LIGPKNISLNSTGEEIPTGRKLFLG